MANLSKDTIHLNPLIKPPQQALKALILTKHYMRHATSPFLFFYTFYTLNNITSSNKHHIIKNEITKIDTKTAMKAVMRRLRTDASVFRIH